MSENKAALSKNKTDLSEDRTTLRDKETNLKDLFTAPHHSSTIRGDKASWLARVQVLATEEQGGQVYNTTVAVWANSHDDFQQQLRSNIRSRHLTVVHCENAMPAAQWLYHYPDDYTAVKLAQGVFEGWPIAFGQLVQRETTDSQSAAKAYLRITEHTISPLADQPGVPFWEKEWIAPELYALLFAQPEFVQATSDTQLHTYFIVDAALRSTITKVFDLESLKLPIRCLFKGDHAIENQQVAPYLIDMSLPKDAWEDKDQVPDFHKDFFARHWAQNTGVFIRSSVSFDALWKHLRKFTRVQVESDQRWVFFRFWDPRLAPGYFNNIATTPKKLAQWINIRNTHPIEQLIGNKLIGNSAEHTKAWCLTADKNALETINSAGMLTLSPAEIEGFKQQKSDQWRDKLLAELSRKYPFYHQSIGDKGLCSVIQLGIDNAEKYHLTQRDTVTLYIHLMLYLGSYFDTDPLLPWAQQVLNSEQEQAAQTNKANLLRQGLIEYQQATSGTKGEYLQGFIRRCQQTKQPPQATMDNRSIQLFIQQHYPEKYHYLGEHKLTQLLEHTREYCQHQQLREDRSVFTLSCLRLVYGTQVMKDPLYPWLNTLFKDNHTQPKDKPASNTKDEDLARESQQFYSRVIAHIEGK